jgi:hypothetical protein
MRAERRSQFTASDSGLFQDSGLYNAVNENHNLQHAYSKWDISLPGKDNDAIGWLAY